MSLLTYTLSLLLALGTTQPTTTAPATTQPLSAKQTLVAAHRAMIDANMLAVLSLYMQSEQIKRKSPTAVPPTPSPSPSLKKSPA